IRARRRHALARAARRGFLQIGEHAGTLVCHWDAYDAARNREILDRQLVAEFETDWTDAKKIHGDAVSVEVLARSDDQRFADAVTASFQRAAAAPPGSKLPRPVGNVHLDWHSFCELMTERGLFPQRNLDPFEDPTPLVSKMRCHTGDGVAIDPDTALR